MNMKIEQAESRLAQKLDNTLQDALHDLQLSAPNQYRIRISLIDASGRKKRSNASADNWSPESGRIEISFEPSTSEEPLITPVSGPSARASGIPEQFSANSYIHPAELELINVLARAESRPGWSFVPLRKFRDEILASEHIPCLRTEVERQNVLRSAIDKKLVLVGKVQNPKTPEFPVTTIRLNRLMPEVQHALALNKTGDLDFHPVDIRGEPLSATILRERR